MEIRKCNFEQSNKKLAYKLTKSSGAMVQEAPDGLSVPIQYWALYNDPKEAKDGSLRDNLVLSFIDISGAKYSTISATFIREFLDVAAIMEPDPFAILLVHGTTKGGKPFVSCELDCDYGE